MATPIITDGTMERVVEAPRVVTPVLQSVFADRATRFEQLARDHAMADFLMLMSRIAQAQHAIVGRRQPPALPAAALEHSREYGMPPASALSHERAASWQQDLADLLVECEALGVTARQLEASRVLDGAACEALADRILAGTTLDADAAAVPFVGAALQVYFARLAASIEVGTVADFDVATVCPVCGTRPVASVVRIGGDRNNLRYLVCALCSSEWNVARIKCSACEQDKGVHYLSLTAAGDAGPQSEPARNESGVAAARRAEACDECKSYLKIFYQEKDPYVDATADDLASLALDMLVDEQGFGRSGPNLLFHPGST